MFIVSRARRMTNVNFCIHQSAGSNIFEKIIEEETTKDARDTLKKLYDGGAKLNNVKQQLLNKQYENTHMNDGEDV